MTVSMKRILAAVYRPENTGALVILATAIVDKIDGNAYFPNPVPTLAKVKEAIDALAKPRWCLSRGRAAPRKRGTRRRRLSSLLTRLTRRTSLQLLNPAFESPAQKGIVSFLVRSIRVSQSQACHRKSMR